MRDRELYATILGLRDPWAVGDVELDAKQETVRVIVSAREGTQFTCPECNAVSPRHDHRRREWRHLDTCQFQTILVSDVPRVRCAEHGVRQVKVPWADPGSGFTALFEALVIDWLKEASILAVARRMSLTWDQAAGIQERAVARGLARRELQALPFVGVDETSFRRRHDYVTVVSDLLNGTVVHVADDRKRAALDAFFEQLSEPQRVAIAGIAMDMWQPYIASARAWLPDAEHKICFDRFHVSKHLGTALDQVRRAEHRQRLADGDPLLTNTKHLWLQRAETLEPHQENVLAILRREKLRTARAWAIKEAATELWRYLRRGCAVKAWKRWLSWAMRSRLEPMKKAARMVRDHLWGIINAATTGLTNAGSESVNARIQRVKKMACGFRNKLRFRAAIYFHLGGLDLYPEALSITHTKA